MTLDRPLDGDKVELESQTVQALASDADRVAGSEFFVGNTLLTTASTGSTRFVEAIAGWTPIVGGTCSLRAKAVYSHGDVGAAAAAIIVLGRVANVTLTPAVPRLITPVPMPVATEQIVGPRDQVLIESHADRTNLARGERIMWRWDAPYHCLPSAWRYPIAGFVPPMKWRVYNFSQITVPQECSSFGLFVVSIKTQTIGIHLATRFWDHDDSTSEDVLGVHVAHRSFPSVRKAQNALAGGKQFVPGPGKTDKPGRISTTCWKSFPTREPPSASRPKLSHRFYSSIGDLCSLAMSSACALSMQ